MVVMNKNPTSFTILKKIAKTLTPNFILFKIQLLRSKIRSKRYKNLSVQDIFSEIYDKNLWGQSENPQHPYFSGSGSHDKKITEVYINSVGNLLKSLPNIPNVVDLGCGDFSVGSKLRKYCNNYIACDIVSKVIDQNKIIYKNLNVDFRLINIITEKLPIGDLVFIRQVLQHLSNEQIQYLIPKLYKSYKYLVLTEHLPKTKLFVPNLDKSAGPDIRLGYNSGIILTKPPFNLKFIDDRVICEASESNGIIRTNLYQLKH